MKNVIAIAISALFATAAFASPITVPATVSTGGVAGLAGVSAAVGGTSSVWQVVPRNRVHSRCKPQRSL
jgi:hypothetical protein